MSYKYWFYPTTVRNITPLLLRDLGDQATLFQHFFVINTFKLFLKIFISPIAVFLPTGKGGILIEKLAGSVVILTCNSSHSQSPAPSANHYWWFNKQLMSGGDFKPIDIGLFNVQVRANNNSYSYAQIGCVLPSNQGNYTCRVGNETVSTYKLNISDKGT